MCWGSFLVAICHQEEPNGCARTHPCSLWRVKTLLREPGLQHKALPVVIYWWNKDFSTSKTSVCHFRSTPNIITFPILQSSRKKINNIRNTDVFSVGLLFHLCIPNELSDTLCALNNASPLMFGRDYSHKRESLCQNNENKKVFKIKMSGR